MTAEERKNMQIKDYLKEHRLITDGAMGTYYSSIVNRPGAISEFANQSDPETIEGIHTEYLNAGARMIRTNTFAANRAVLKLPAEEQRLLIKSACDIAKRAVNQRIKINKDPIWIVGDIGPIPEDAKTEEIEVLEEYQFICDCFLEAGLDGIHFETFSNVRYIEKLIPYIRDKNKEILIITSFSLNKNGYSSSGISAGRILAKLQAIGGIDVYGFNCGIGSGHMHQIISRLSLPEGALTYVAPNAGYPEQMQNRLLFMDNEEYFAQNMKLIADSGISILGGCCGTTPSYIENLSQNLNTTRVNSLLGHRKSLTSHQVNYTKENDFCQLLNLSKKVIAVELDPPYDANIDQIMECAHSIKSSGADIITFADSPMGRSRVDSILMSIKIANETGMSVMPHVCCRDRNMISMRSNLLGAYIHNLRNLLIVTGDPVPQDSRVSTTGVFDYNSVQLMDFVKEMNVEHFQQEPIAYGGALNYGRGKVENVVERMKKKINAGATYFLTQPIYSDQDVERIAQIKEMVDTKILCGILPFVSYRNACFIKNEISGIYVPDEMVERYRPDMTKEEAENVGAAMAIEIMEKLDPIADGYYFMLPFNRVSLLDKILKQSML